MNIQNKRILLFLLQISVCRGWGGVLATEACCASEAVPTNPDTTVLTPYAGSYIGGGLGHQYTIGNAILDDNMGRLAAGVYTSADDVRLVRSNIGTIGGTITAGYGMFDDNYYIGADLCIDITDAKHTRQKEARANEDAFAHNESKIKTEGLIPTVALRLGRYFSSVDCLAYARLGLTSLRNEFQNDTMLKTKFRTQPVSPIVGFGFEKSVLDRWSVRSECDYRFVAKSKKDIFVGYDENNEVIKGRGGVEYQGQVYNRAKGYAVRLMCVYHF